MLAPACPDMLAATFSMDIFIDAVGWVGAVAVLVAYHRVSSGRTSGKALGFQLMNLVGAICLGVNTFYKGAFPSTVVNVVWAGIAIAALRPRDD